MAREYARVVGHGVITLAGEAARERGKNLIALTGAAGGLLVSAWPHLEDALRGQLQDRRSALPLRAYVPPPQLGSRPNALQPHRSQRISAKANHSAQSNISPR